jgi:chromosome segregation ATPase
MIEKIVTPDSLAAARDELLSEGKTASIRNIRKKLGGGSLSSIHSGLRLLKTATLEIPLDTQERLRPLLSCGAELLKKAGEEISCALRAENQRLSDDLDSLAQSLHDTEASLSALIADHGSLQESYKALKFDYDREKELLGRRETELDGIKEDLIQAKLNLKGYEAARDEAREARDRAAKLEGRLEVYESKTAQPEDVSQAKEGIRPRVKKPVGELG